MKSKTKLFDFFDRLLDALSHHRRNQPSEYLESENVSGRLRRALARQSIESPDAASTSGRPGIIDITDWRNSFSPESLDADSIRSELENLLSGVHPEELPEILGPLDTLINSWTKNWVHEIRTSHEHYESKLFANLAYASKISGKTEYARHEDVVDKLVKSSRKIAEFQIAVRVGFGEELKQYARAHLLSRNWEPSRNRPLDWDPYGNQKYFAGLSLMNLSHPLAKSVTKKGESDQVVAILAIVAQWADSGLLSTVGGKDILRTVEALERALKHRQHGG